MLRRSQSFVNLAFAAALFSLCSIVWFVQSQHTRAFSSYSSPAAAAANGASTKWPRRVSPQEPLGVEPKLSLGAASGNLLDVQNSTLGFQKIYILSMPNRSDKRDALTLSAYLTGLEVEFIDGVNGSLVSRSAYPENWKMDEPPGTIGCWRGHMEIYQKMVRERIHSAMIMEDDVDWDVMIKAQMTEFARGTRHLQKAPEYSHSPYGDGWDILTMGHCGLWNKVADDQEYWVTNNDPTVIAPSLHGWWRKPNLSPAPLHNNYSRVVFSPYKLTCLASYAISLPGAARILYDQSVLPNGVAIDVGLSAMCKRQEYGYNSCLGAYPMITGIHRPAGDMAKESDRKLIKEGQVRKVASSDNLVYPVRLNLASLLKGDTVVKAQYPDNCLMKELDTATFQLPRGGPVFIKRSEYIMEPVEPLVEEGASEADKPVDDVAAGGDGDKGEGKKGEETKEEGKR